VTELTLIHPDPGFGGKEKRAFPRLHWKAPIRSTSGEEYLVQDFSPGGVGLISKIALKARQFIEFALNPPGVMSPTVLTCQVLWVRKDQRSEEYIAGTRFVSDSENEYSLTRYLYNVIKSRIEGDSVSLTPINLLSKENLDRSLVNKIQNVELPPFFRSQIATSRRFNHRPEYIWKWCYQAMKETTLSTVHPEFAQLLDNTKLTSFMLSILLDDLADEKGDTSLLEECCKMIFFRQPIDFSGFSEEDRLQGNFIKNLWTIIQSNMKQFARFDEFSEIIHYDFQQIVNTLKYALLSNKTPGMINEREAILYEGNNINVMTDLMMDIMCSPAFEAGELGLLREVGWHAQMMCKIANWVSTWKREVRIGDWTSGVIAKGLGENVIEPKSLFRDNHAAVINNIEESGVEESLLCDWERHRIWIAKHCDQIKSVDLRAYSRGIEAFYRMQLISKGLQ